VPHRQCLSLPSAPTLCCGCKLLSALAMNKGGERENWSTVFAKSIAAVKGNISTLKLSMRVSSCGLRGGVSSECGEHDPFFAWIDTTPAARPTYDSHVEELYVIRLPTWYGTSTQKPVLGQSGSLVNQQTSLRESIPPRKHTEASRRKNTPKRSMHHDGLLFVAFVASTTLRKTIKRMK
jgi:hypothetical protein